MTIYMYRHGKFLYKQTYTIIYFKPQRYTCINTVRMEMDNDKKNPQFIITLLLTNDQFHFVSTIKHKIFLL